jgi:tetratricopeptide (TPR) repeat protein
MMKDSKLQEEEFKCVSLLGSISLNMGDLESAENLAATAYALAKQLKNKPAIAESLLLRASIALESEKFMEARHCLKKILKNKAFCEENKPKTKKMLAVSAKLQFSLQRLKGQVGGDEEIRLLDSLADDYCSVECFYSALRYYKRMLDAAKNSEKSSSELAAIFVSLAQTSADLKNYADAIRYAREEVNLRDDPEQRCRTWLNIADYSHRMEDGDAAGIVEIYEKAIKEAQPSGKTKLLARCLRYQQTVFRGMDDLEKVDDLETRIREIKPTEDGESEEEDEDALSRASSPDTPNCSSLTESDDENEVDDDGPFMNFLLQITVFPLE